MNIRRIFVFPLVAVALCIVTMPTARASRVALPDPAVDDAPATASGKATLVLAGGCFWGMEEVFQHVRGVTAVTSGYSGGAARTATYEQVSSGTTGHAESVLIEYDPATVSMGRLLKVFFSVAHDPTQVGGQGPDKGPQYRSAIFFSSERQQQLAKAYVDQLTSSKVFHSAITTQLVRLTKFYRAEEEHQDFARKNPDHRYIRLIDLPKVEDLQKVFPALYVK